jgi:hypothetical protein
MNPNTRLILRAISIATVCAGCLVAALIYVVHAVIRAPHGLATASQNTSASLERSQRSLAPQNGQHYLLFRSTALGDTYGRIALAQLDMPDGPRTMAALRCDRVHFAAGRGVCLTAHRGVVTTYEAVIFDGDFQPQHRLPLKGIPSRVRVSPDGRFAAMTVFVSGHSYAVAGFSTQTSIIDLRTGEVIVADMEKFAVWRDGERFQAIDANFWGVTFARDSHRFYATLGSNGRTYLIEGDLTAREAQVRRADIECPSLSPDNSRLAFKKRVGGLFEPVRWRLSVLDLVTLGEWMLAETRSVDDQVEWLDDQHVLYALPDRTSGTPTMNTWVVGADGGGEPRQLIVHAYSPVVVGR